MDPPSGVKIPEKSAPLDQTTWPIFVIRVMSGPELRLCLKTVPRGAGHSCVHR